MAKTINRTQTTVLGDYRALIPFDKSIFITEHTLDADDVLMPDPTIEPEIGCGALYRLIGNGVNAPVFDPIFKKSVTSADYDPAPSVVNMIIFMFDGFDYWYTITQPVSVPN